MKGLLFFKVVLFLGAILIAYVLNWLMTSPANGFIQQNSILLAITFIVLSVAYYLYRIDQHNRNKYELYYNS